MKKNDNSKVMQSISKIDKQERAGLFEEFVSISGSIGSEEDNNKSGNDVSSRKGPAIIPADLSLKTNDPDTVFSNAIKEFSAKDSIKKKVFVSDTYIKNNIDKYHLGKTTKLFKSLECYFSGITNLSGNYIKPKFVKDTYYALRDGFFVLKTSSLFIVDSPIFKRSEIFQSFASNYPIFTEIILRFYSMDLSKLLIKFKTQDGYTINHIKTYYFHLLKSIFFLIERQDMVYSAYMRALKVLGQLNKYEKQVLHKEETRVKNAIKEIYSSFLPKMEKLYPLLVLDNIYIISAFSKKHLSLEERDFLGSLSDYVKKLLSQPYNTVGDNTKGSGNSAENIYSRGVNFIYSILSSTDDVPIDIINYPKKDKIFHLVYLLDYCSKRYSLLNNNNVVNFASLQENGERFVLEEYISEFFMNIDKLFIGLKTYSQIIHNTLSLTQTNMGTPLAKDAEQLQKYRTKVNNQLREQVVQSLSILVTALTPRANNFSKYIKNYADMVSDDLISEATKDFANQTIVVVLEDFYIFVSGLYYLLTSLDLSGPSPLVDNTSILLVEEDL